jgi:hypothetical protein
LADPDGYLVVDDHVGLPHAHIRLGPKSSLADQSVQEIA